jgi:hypothetical protein
MSRRKARGLRLVLAVLLTGLAPACKKKTVALTPDLAGSDEALYKLGEVLAEYGWSNGLENMDRRLDSFFVRIRRRITG